MSIVVCASLVFYAFWMSFHRLIKKSRASSFPIGLFAILLKTVLTSALKMPELGSSNISNNLPPRFCDQGGFYNKGVVIAAVEIILYFFFTPRVRWLVCWHTWPQESCCLSWLYTDWKQSHIRSGHHSLWLYAGSLIFRWVKRSLNRQMAHIYLLNTYFSLNLAYWRRFSGWLIRIA